MLLKRAVLCGLLTLGCGPCGGGTSVAGDTPFDRCIAREPAPPPAAIGTVKLGLKERVLSVTGLPASPRVAFFQGPGMATQLSAAETLRSLARDAPDLMVVLGGIGLEPGGADLWLASLLKIGRPVLLMAGGRDSAASTAGALHALADDLRGRVVDVSAIHVVNLSGYSMVLVSGADSGAAAIAGAACGFSEDDVAAVRASLEEHAERSRVLVSWEIPADEQAGRLPAAIGGAALLADLREVGGFRAGIHAWPDHDVLRPAVVGGGTFVWGQASTGFELTVPRIVGAPHERADGTRQLPGYLIVRFEKAGIVAEKPR